MTQRAERTGEFTGKHMLMLMIAFFGVVIAVNVVMATLAGTSWTGLVVKNSYVASQEFNERAAEGREQAALGWKATLEVRGGLVSYRLVDASGSPIPVQSVTAVFRRPVYEAEDMTLHLARAEDGSYSVAQAVRDGVWIVETDADVSSVRPYRDVRRIVVTGGTAK